MNLKGRKKVLYLSKMPQNCFYHKIAAYVISWISVLFFFLYLSFWEKYVGKGRFFCILLLHVWVNTWLAGDHSQGKTHTGTQNFWSLIQRICFTQRAIFQTFWKTYNCTIFSFFEIETSNFGCSYVFSSPLKWWGRIWPNLTFWIQKRHISGKVNVVLT